TPATRKRILVVDDSSLVRLYCQNTLTAAGFDVDQAINGIEAMEKVVAEPFDLVIVDVNMPRMDGLSFIRALRVAAPEIGTIPALIMRTEDGQKDIEDSRVAGANFYLVKPVSDAVLLRHVAALTGVRL